MQQESAANETRPGDAPGTGTPRADVRARSLRYYLLFVAAKLILSLVAIMIFVRQFGFGPRLVLFHAVVIAALIIAEIIFSIFIINLRFLRERKLSGAIVSLSAGLSLLLVSGCYALGYASCELWGSYITLSLMARFLPQFFDTIGALPVNPVLIVAGVVSLPVAIIGFIIAFSGTLVSGLTELTDRFNRHVVGRLGLQSVRATVFTVIFATGVLAPFALYMGIPSVMTAGDPVVSILASGRKQENDVHALGLSAGHERALYPRHASRLKKNVILIICDALRRDHMGMYGYARETTPFLDGLYRSGKLFRQDPFFSTCSASYCGIMSTLTSKSWNEIGLFNFALHDLLKDQGYRINFIVSGDHTSWENLKHVYGKSVDYFYDGSSSRRFSINDDLLLFEGLEAVPAFSGQPSFFYFHLMSPHVAGVRRVKRYAPTMLKGLTDDGSAKVCYENNYDNGIVQADLYIQRIFDALGKKGYLEDSMVIITSDHGEEIYENGRTGHLKDLNWYSIDIPLLIYDERPAVYRHRSFAGQVDIAATVLDRLGLPLPESWEGASLMKNALTRCTIHQMNEYIAVITSRDAVLYKYLYNTKTGEERLFDIASDRHETASILGKAPREVVAACRAKVKKSLGISIR